MRFMDSLIPRLSAFFWGGGGVRVEIVKSAEGLVKKLKLLGCLQIAQKLLYWTENTHSLCRI